MAVKVERIGETRNKLGEGPLWDVEEQALYWIDGEGAEIHRYDPLSGAFKSWRLPGPIGSMALRRQGGAVLALFEGFHFFDFTTGKATLIANPEADDPRTRFNDGKVDRRGRFIAATLDRQLTQPFGSLYRLDPDLRCSRLDQGFALSNGPCWSPDGSIFYFADSGLSTIFRYDYDMATGEISNRRVFIDTKEMGGRPDGCTVDSNGRIWASLIGSAKIACFNPDGELERTVEVPTRLNTSVMFGGKNLDVLYVTSIGGFPAEGIEPGENDGGLYAIYGLGVTGLPEPRFAG